MPRRILLIDTDREGAASVQQELEKAGFAVDAAHAAAEAAHLIPKRIYDLVLMDVALLQTDGNKLLRQIYRCGDLPLLFIRPAASSLREAVGLGVKHDAYLTKPLSQDGLERIRQHLRWHRQVERMRAADASTHDAGPLHVDLRQARVWVNEAEVVLAPREYELLKFFLAHPGQVLTKAQILWAIWGTNSPDNESTVIATIRRLRTKIEPDPAAPTLIRTVWGAGYMLTAKGR